IRASVDNERLPPSLDISEKVRNPALEFLTTPKTVSRHGYVVCVMRPHLVKEVGQRGVARVVIGVEQATDRHEHLARQRSDKTVYEVRIVLVKECLIPHRKSQTSEKRVCIRGLDNLV